MGPGPMDLAGSLGTWTRPGSIQLQYQLQAMSQSSHSTNDRAELPPRTIQTRMYHCAGQERFSFHRLTRILFRLHMSSMKSIARAAFQLFPVSVSSGCRSQGIPTCTYRINMGIPDGFYLRFDLDNYLGKMTSQMGILDRS